jgi:broad specificity phosphatase PhoE
MLLNLNNLKHNYYLVRHGNSVANQKEIIVNSLQEGIKLEYGLTEKGQMQAKLSAQLFQSQVSDTHNLIILHSPLTRAKQTAEIMSEVFGVKIFGEEVNLRERDAGDLELSSTKGYQSIWEQDKLNPDHTWSNCESLNCILERMLKVIENCEKLDSEYGSNILLVGHAEAIHILETAFRNIPVQNHRDIPYIRNAEIRSLN